ncbi:hypothetical protein DFH07DRAFT_782067 [Mycena maculata]|uniref:Uncharacterized protein n=1 Tax=Mycena maculata TaxID=230809 RepID=A0AAD7HWL9_9AGAR|nr:hypothetical protein DFH07DRAFT_782067 [Mycena maculata]
MMENGADCNEAAVQLWGKLPDEYSFPSAITPHPPPVLLPGTPHMTHSPSSNTEQWILFSANSRCKASQLTALTSTLVPLLCDHEYPLTSYPAPAILKKRACCRRGWMPPPTSRQDTFGSNKYSWHHVIGLHAQIHNTFRTSGAPGAACVLLRRNMGAVLGRVRIRVREATEVQRRLTHTRHASNAVGGRARSLHSVHHQRVFAKIGPVEIWM